MKVQLINAPYLQTYGRLEKIAAVYFPLGLGYLASFLRTNGFPDLDLFDPEAEKTEKIEQRIANYSPEIVGISCVTATYNKAREIAALVKKINPKILVIAGGVHVSALPKESMKECADFDLVVIGEGEMTFLNICRRYSHGKSLKGITGTAYRNGKQVICAPPRRFICDLDKIPYPARDLIDLSRYHPPSHMNIGRRSVTLVSSRGCPGTCSFCASWVVAGRKFRAHSPQYVVGEIDCLQRRYGFDHFIFEDDSFTIDQERVAKICRLLIARDKPITWSCFGRVNTVDSALLKLMKNSGCYLIGFGVESGDKAILEKIRKGITIDECRAAFKNSKKVGLKTQGFFMIGNPGETKETIKKTINFAIELDPDFAFFSPLVPYPGTEIYKNSQCLMVEPSVNWSDYSAFGDRLALSFHHLSQEQLKDLYSLANKRFYLRPKYMINKILKLSSLSELAASIKGGLVLLGKKYE